MKNTLKSNCNHTPKQAPVWDCGSDSGSKCFSLRNASK